MKTIMSDPDMEETFRVVDSYIVCIKVKDIDTVDRDTDFIQVDKNLTDTSHVSMFLCNCFGRPRYRLRRADRGTLSTGLQ